jgi:hypothetical protein
MKKAIALVVFALALEGALVISLAVPAGAAPAAGAPARMVQAAAPKPVRS